jgi:tetratricopeptide (TPR) repeat protein
MSRPSSRTGFSESEPPTGPSLMDAWSSGLHELGGYQLVRPVGSGGMGAVFEAIEQQTGRRVAIKTLHRTDPSGLIALKGEFRRMTDVVHKNLALLHELVQDGELLYFAMEFVEGLDFYRYVTGSSMPNAPTLLAADDPSPSSRPKPIIHRFRERRLRNSLIQLASGVLALHQEGLLHLDLKPANVLVENGGRVVILDFGLVRPQSSSAESQMFCGTPAYMAPEQAEGRAGPPADAYAMGVMLFEALTGDLPFDVRGHAGIFGKLRNEAPSASSRRADVPRDLDELCSELLAREPGRRPSVDTIVKRLMPSSSVRLAPAGGTPTTSTAGPRAELIGREDELEVLLDALERCRHGEPQQVYVDGPSGVGKTALLQRFVERAGREHGTLVLEARCYERESIPYKAVDALIDSLAPHLVTRLHAALGDLNDVLRAFPALGPDRGGGQLPQARLAGNPHEARRRAFRGLRALLADLAHDRPLVLAIDDLQWGDLDSARLLVEVLAPPNAPQVLFVGTYRSEERGQSAFLQELLRRGQGPGVVMLTLAPLSFAQAEAVALGMLERTDEDARRLAREVAGESGGNPLLIDSLISHRSSADGAAQQTKASLESVVLAALSSLPAEARRLLEIIAVAGQPLPQGLALSASSVGSERHAVLAHLRTAHLIRTRGTSSSDPLDVYHDRIREVLYAHLPRLTLRSLHRHLANALEAQGDAQADLLARQFNAAGVVEKAGHYATLAAERASAALAFNQASELYTLAVESRPDDLELRIRHAEALVQAGHGAEAAHAFLACSRVAPPEQALTLERNAARQLLFAGHVEEGIGLLRPLLAHYRLRLPGTSLGLGITLVWRMLRASLRGTDFVLRSAESIDQRTLARIDTAISTADGLSSIDLVRAASVMLDALLLSLRAGERSRIAWCLAQYGLFTATKGTARAIARGEELLARAENLGRGLGDANLEGAFKLAWSKAALAIGDFRAALTRADACADHLRSQCASASGPISIAQNVSLMALECLGDFNELCRRAESNIELAAALGDRYVMVTSLAFLAQGRLAAGDVAGARAALREGREVWSASGFMLQNWLMLAAEAAIALYEDDPMRAWSLLEENRPAVSTSRLLDVQLLRVLWLRLRGNAALACVRASRGSVRHFIGVARHDAEQLARLRQNHARAASGVLRAGIAWFEGNTEQAGLQLTRAVATYEQAGMVVAASSARLRRSFLAGGGTTDATAAGDAMRELGIGDPDRYARLHAP